MKLKHLMKIIFDEVIIYKNIKNEYIDLYCGKYNAIPEEILEMEVKVMRARSKGIIDIQVH